jgi:hypothetical protein
MATAACAQQSRKVLEHLWTVGASEHFGSCKQLVRECHQTMSPLQADVVVFMPWCSRLLRP